jgi:RNA polymerase sigma-70 factor (ECF subfamily)
MFEGADIDDWFARNVLPHEGDLRRWLARFAPGIDADDIVQETYAGMAKDYRAIQTPRAFMFTVARNAVIAQLRHKRIVNIVAIADLDALPVVDGSATGEQQLVGREELSMLQQAIAHLPDRCREVLTLRKIQGLPQREVAERLGLSESTVEKHVSAGIRRCADWFARVEPKAASAQAAKPKTRGRGR